MSVTYQTQVNIFVAKHQITVNVRDIHKYGVSKVINNS